ncbi:MAG: S-layer homology domain-containing protein [Bacillota bacterium]
MGQFSKSLRMFMAAVITTVFVSTAVTPVAAAAFVDVSDRYKESVDYLVEQEITNGLTDTTFGVNSQIKRADAAVMITRALELDGSQAPDAGFKDVPARAITSVNILKNKGIINGKTSTNFGSDDTLTRGEMAIILSRAYHFTGEADLPFIDVNSRYSEYVRALIANGITQGKSETLFGTNQHITRGEFALFIYRSEHPVNPKIIEVLPAGDIVAHTYMDVHLPTKVQVMVTGNNVEERMVSWEMVDYSSPGDHIVYGEVDGTDLKASVKITIETSLEAVADQKAAIAIAELPDVITLNDEEKVKAARELVEKALEIGSEGKIEGLDILEKAEATITLLYAKAAAEEAIRTLPETVTLLDKEKVHAVRNKVEEVYKLNADAVIEGIGTLEEVEKELRLLSLMSEAEEAISNLPKTITLADEDLIEIARQKVDAVFEVDSKAVIQGLDILEGAESTIHLLHVKSDAEQAISAIPETITLKDRASVEAARMKVESAFQLDSNLLIQGIEKLEEAEKRIQTLFVESAEITLNSSQLKVKTNKTYQLTATIIPSEVAEQLDVTWSSDNPSVATVDENGLITSLTEGEATITAELENGKTAFAQVVVSNRPDLWINSYGSVTINNVIKSVSTSFYNLSDETVHVKKIEIYEGASKKTEYTETKLKDSGINTQISPSQQFSLGITYNFGGLLKTNQNYVKYTIVAGEDTYVFESLID